MRNWWKDPKIIGSAAYIAMLLLRCTLRTKFIRHPDYDPKTTYVFYFWHGKQLLPAMLTIQVLNIPMCALVSPSRDGGMLAAFLEKIGYIVIRGSSRDNGLRALLQMKSILSKGISVGFAPDGPIGPIYKVKPGVVFLAQKQQLKIVPVGSAFSSCWTFNKAWDKFQVPKPFSKAAMVFAKPVSISADDDIQATCAKLEKLLHQVEEQAAALVR